MLKATITTKKGAKIVIEGTQSEIKELIASIESSSKETVKGKSAKKGKQQKEKSNTATDIILSLRESGYFSKPRSLTDIKKALAEQGMIYPITTLSGVLLRIVRKRFLGRIKEKNKWCYVKR